MESECLQSTIHKTNDASPRYKAWRKRLELESPTKCGKNADLQTYINRSYMRVSKNFKSLVYHIVTFEEAYFSTAVQLVYIFRDSTLPLRTKSALRANRMGPLTLTDFRYGKHLGSGTFGIVFCVEEKSTGRLLALKIQALADWQSAPYFLTRLIVERDALLRISHPLVVRLYHAFLDGATKTICFGFEYCPGGNLEDIVIYIHGDMFCNADGIASVVTSGINLPISSSADLFAVARFYIGQVIAGVTYIHSRGILHLDLKCDNVFLSSSGRVKIGDLGLAARFHWTHCFDRTRPYVVQPDYETWEAGGARIFLEPELMFLVIEGREREIVDNFVFLSDWYSVGCIAWQLFAGFFFNDLTMWIDVAAKAGLVHFWDLLPRNRKLFMFSCVGNRELREELIGRNGCERLFGNRAAITEALIEFFECFLVLRKDRLVGRLKDYNVYRNGLIVVDHLIDLDEINKLRLFDGVNLWNIHCQAAPLDMTRILSADEDEVEATRKNYDQLPQMVLDWAAKPEHVLPISLPEFPFRRPDDDNLIGEM